MEHCLMLPGHRPSILLGVLRPGYEVSEQEKELRPPPNINPACSARVHFATFGAEIDAEGRYAYINVNQDVCSVSPYRPFAGIFQFDLNSDDTPITGELVSRFEYGTSPTNDLMRGADNKIYISQTINPRVFNEGAQNASSRTQGHTFWHRSGKRLGVIHFPEKASEFGFTWEGPKLAELEFPDLSQVLSSGHLGNFPATPAYLEGSVSCKPIDLGTNPRACCGTQTEIFDVTNAVDDDHLFGNDVHYTFTLEKHCDFWPTLQINTNSSDFDVVTKVEYWGINNRWNNLDQNSTNIWDKDNLEFIVAPSFPTGTTANFRIQIDANNSNETGSFKLEIAAIKQSNADPLVCAEDFNSCCRIAVDTGSYIPIEYAITSPSSFDFKLVPNPAKEQVSIYFNTDLDEHAQIELFDGLGKVHKNSIVFTKESTFDLRTIPAGIYSLRVSSQGKQKSKKLVLVR